MYFINKKKSLTNFPNIFKTKYDLISDYDFTLKYSRTNKFVCVQKPIVVYRKHKNSMSILNYEKQINQLEMWYNEEKNFFFLIKMI